MIKKLVLLSTLILVSVFYKTAAFAETGYSDDMYLSRVKDKIDSNWFEPLNSKEKGAVVTFDINKDGRFSNVKFLRSSNDEDFDKSALEAVYKASESCPVPSSNPLSVQVYMHSGYMNIGRYDKNPILPNSNSGIINVANRDVNGDFSAYTENLINQISTEWHPKYKKDREAIVSVKIDKDGALNNVEFLKTSRKAKFNKEVVDAISNSVPFSPLPAQFSENSKDVILTFEYSYDRKNKNTVYYINSQIDNKKGYDKYAGEINSIISNALEEKRLFLYKDILLMLSIDKTGKLEYVKIKQPTSSVRFNRYIISTIQNLSFPPIPEEMNANSFTTDFKIVTQREPKFKDLMINYFIYLGRKRLSSFCI